MAPPNVVVAAAAAAPAAGGCRVIPNSGAIYSSSDVDGRTFYYSSLNIEWLPPQWKWKVHVGELVAVSTSTTTNATTVVSETMTGKTINNKSNNTQKSTAKRQQQQHVQEIEQWEPGHYEKASPHWRVGLVVALSKRISKTVQTGGTFDCHVQWLDKAMDLSKAELESFQSSFRPFKARKGKNTGSQLPHILINRPGDFGIISLLSILPVEIGIMAKQDFTIKGVLERDESHYSLQFCCNQTRRDGFLQASCSEEEKRKVFREPNPDAWTFVNPPRIDSSASSSSTSTSVVAIHDLPQPLEKAWEMWLSSANCSSIASGRHHAASLKEALKKGWRHNRRERHTKAVLDHQAKQKELASMRQQNRDKSSKQAASNATKVASTGAENTANNNNNKSATKRSAKRPVSTTTGKKKTGLQYPEGSEEEKPLKKKKGIRFSADTKENTQRKGSTSKIPPKVQNTAGKRQRPGAVQTNLAKRPNKSARITDDDSSNSTVTRGSTITQDTHSTDTTLPTRGAGRKQSSKSNSVGADDDDESSTLCTSATSSTDGSKMLPKWSIAPSQEDLIYEKGKRKYYGRLGMSVNVNDLSQFLSDYNPGLKKSRMVSFHYEIGSVVVVYCDEAIASDGSWSPFHVPWGVAQITSIYQNLEESDDSLQWKIGIKWFYRYSELQKTRQNLVQGAMDETVGLVETQESSICSSAALLPTYVALVTDRSLIKGQGHFELTKSGNPIIYRICSHKSESKTKILETTDWNVKILERQLDHSQKFDPIPTPVQRAIPKRPNHLHENSIIWLQKGDGISVIDKHGSDFPPPTEPSKPRKSTQLVLSAPSPVYEQWGEQFYESVELKVDKKVLRSHVASKLCGWTLFVGMVVPVRCKYTQVPPKKDNLFLPFKVQWSPAQVVAIYKSESGEWMIQIRWFQRFCEILEHHQNFFQYLDQDHIVFETEVYGHVPIEDCLPGRVVLTSNESVDNWDASRNGARGLPLIPLLCTHICLDEEIDSSIDWTNYDLTISSVPPPLSRGLCLTPANRPNKNWVQMLFRHYTKAISRRQQDPDQDALMKMSCVNQPHRGSNSQTFDPIETEVSLDSPINTDTSSSLHFFKSMAIAVPISCIVKPTIEMKRRKSYSFDCTIGDIICFYDKSVNAADLCQTATRIRHPFSPFQIPWSLGQILSIWKETESGSGEQMKVELRRFFRPCDLPADALSFVPFDSNTDLDETFESDVVINVDASRVVGLAEIFLGHHTSSGVPLASSVRLVDCRCKYFYLSAFQRVQPLYCSSFIPGDWQVSLRRRGVSLSHVLRKHASVKNEILSNENNGQMQPNLLQLLSPTKQKVNGGVLISVKRPLLCSNTPGSFYGGAVLRPQWSIFCTTDVMFTVDEARECTWNLSIGDFLAVKINEASDVIERYPYKVPWAPCQLLSVFGEPFNVQFEVRVLDFRTSDSGEEVTEKVPEHVKIVGAADLLGPFALNDRSMNFKASPDTAFLPLVTFWASKSLNLEISHALSFSMQYDSRDLPHVKDLLCFVPEGLLKASYQGKTDHQRSMPGESWAVEPPFHVESSTRRAFFEEVFVMPLFTEHLGSHGQRDTSEFIVRAGDVILVRFEGPKRYPLNCNWAVADVVSMFSDGSRNSSAGASSTGAESSGDHPFQHMKAEIRWFHDRNDFTSVAPADGLHDDEEVFETDHIQVIEIGNFVLSRASLFDSKKDLEKSNEKHKFICKRFWSTQRKSLIPCGGLDGRKKRALLHSKVLPQKYISPVQPRKNASLQGGSRGGWKSAMVKLQQKLTLKDASRNAQKDQSSLVGREKEILELLSFFRSAIRAETSAGEVKAAMIVAGPPGVGKTASVHVAISQLLKEQDEGKVPRFRFICLNGMEQRHPYDTYIRFLEALTGKKHTGSHDRACELLEEHFATSSSSADGITTVVLLDEIDYLITEKQSVLYNFFNWPKLAANVSNGRRLVVVGLSNTLNLVEQLIPSVQSRVGTEKCIFKAYSLQDTVKILKAKMAEASKDFDFFEDDAILFAAKKTAALSGDIRKAFQICRVAAESVTQKFEKEEEDQSKSLSTAHPKIKISDVQKASQESFNKALVTAVSFCTPFQALLLIALASLCRATGREVGGFELQDVLTKMEAMANGSGDSQYARPPNVNETLQLVNTLGEMNLVKLKTEKNSSCPWPKATLVVDELTLLKGFKNTTHKKLAQKYVPSLY